jgi:hypothetical protein
MSAKMSAWAWNLEFKVASHKLVMLQLADNADNEGLCYPFIKRIASYTCLKPRQVQYILKELEKLNYISIEERFKRDRNQSSNCYTINYKNSFPKITHSNISPPCTAASNLSTGVHSSAGGGCTGMQGGDALECTGTPPKSEENFSKNNTLTPSAISITKSSLTKNITERESALSIFLPDERNKLLASDLKIDIEIELKSFLGPRGPKQKSQEEFSRWLKIAKEYQNKKQISTRNTQEAYSAVNKMDYFEASPDFVKRYNTKEYGSEPIRNESHGREVSRNNLRGDNMRKATEYLRS